MVELNCVVFPALESNSQNFKPYLSENIKKEKHEQSCFVNEKALLFLCFFFLMRVAERDYFEEAAFSFIAMSFTYYMSF